MAIFFSLSFGLKVKLIFERQIEALMKNKAMKNKAKAQSKNKSWRLNIMEIKYAQLMREIRGWGPKILIKLGS